MNFIYERDPNLTRLRPTDSEEQDVYNQLAASLPDSPFLYDENLLPREIVLLGHVRRRDVIGFMRQTSILPQIVEIPYDPGLIDVHLPDDAS